MIKAFILAGTNLGDRIANLEIARRMLAEKTIVTQFSALFETEPVGFADQPWYLNQAIELEVSLPPQELLSFCLGIEASCGRVRTFSNAPRTLDLDILLYGNVIVHQNNLVIPHPRLHERRFALRPLAQIAPEAVHPVLKKSIRRLLADCPDTSSVVEYNPSHP